ncbi:predicted protein [Postia placenta Mad-698-R]|uniref:Uncharacterized protein n=1 Tax=Postia placenta MAD-698-R-SB12 TaxID=670580 RepID=A0A1X6N5F8_9APHY|nr:hypothetical protein POSPLADRAFT_1045937 [Postia placenta MAD-698-R-SB12]EED84330.1 predicted protein [Postia placenta Mad-698-R]OSX63716.1 hypothetical protein POSPLADRAFT_1045937 [Postia placenta MAD-698-R-SB12]
MSTCRLLAAHLGLGRAWVCGPTLRTTQYSSSALSTKRQPRSNGLQGARLLHGIAHSAPILALDYRLDAYAIAPESSTDGRRSPGASETARKASSSRFAPLISPLRQSRSACSSSRPALGPCLPGAGLHTEALSEMEDELRRLAIK